MNNKFDELTKSLAQSVTRRAALKKLGLGLAGMALACLGLANKAEANSGKCSVHADCPPGNPHCCKKNCDTYTCATDSYYPIDFNYCRVYCAPHGVH